MIKQFTASEQEWLTKALNLLMDTVPIIRTIATAIRAQGGELFIVGGVVRDLVRAVLSAQDSRQVPSLCSDIDIEVFGLSYEQLHKLLSAYGSVNHMGASFGILRIAGLPIDWSIPRIDSAGRKPDVVSIPSLPLAQALRRRDLTMHAMALELTTGILHDPFGGVADIAAGRLRTPDPQLFVQDPLRFYRVMQSIGRFGMDPDEELTTICRTIDLAGLSRERIIAEFEKLLLQSPAPSRGIRWLADLGRLSELVPELGATVGILQDMQWHPEGDVFEHTMQTLDAAAARSYQTPAEKRLILYAALCHDLGKVTTTRVIEGRLRSRGHEIAGVSLAKGLLTRIAQNKAFIVGVCALVRHHMAPGQLVAQHAGAAAYKRLAAALAPHATLAQLALLAYADKRGRNPVRGLPMPITVPVPDIDLFCACAEASGVFQSSEPPCLSGDDIAPFVPAGPERGTVLARAYAIQINEGVADTAALLKRVVKKR